MPPKSKINISALKRLWNLATEPGNSSPEKLAINTLKTEINELVSDEIQKGVLLEAAARCEEDGLVDIRKLYVNLLRKPPEKWAWAQSRPQPAMPAVKPPPPGMPPVKPAMPAVKPPPPPGRPGSAVATAGPASSSLPQEGESLLSGSSEGDSEENKDQAGGYRKRRSKRTSKKRKKSKKKLRRKNKSKRKKRTKRKRSKRR